MSDIDWLRPPTITEQTTPYEPDDAPTFGDDETITLDPWMTLALKRGAKLSLDGEILLLTFE